MKNELLILGIRGIPAQHGGFETFAQDLSKFLIERKWNVTVYCQTYGSGKITESYWEGIKLINVPVSRKGALGTIIFDFKSVCDSINRKGLVLTLGYNTAIFNVLYKLFGRVNLINMDGIEWKREKWSPIAKIWFWLNERFGCWFGTHLIADHPKIKDHLINKTKEHKITMIPYGAEKICEADESVLKNFSVNKNQYSIVVARPEPENSILEIVRAFSTQKRDKKLIVMGNFYPEENEYHKKVLNAGSNEVIFPGAIYDPIIINSLRFFSRFYIHGHKVGGTNPSLVESLGAGCAIVAHDNIYNKWVAGPHAKYFSGVSDLELFFSGEHLDDNFMLEKRKYSDEIFPITFAQEKILEQYQLLLERWHKP